MGHAMRKELKKNRQLYLMCVPAIIFLIMFCYIPMVGIWMAFTDYNIRDGIFGSRFVGLQNFKYFFTGSTGMGPRVIWNTLVINFWGLIFGTIVPITIAICFNLVKGKFFKKFTQSAMFFPYFLSWVVVGAIVYAFFSSDTGLVNRILTSNGFEKMVRRRKVLEADYHNGRYMEVVWIQLNHIFSCNIKL